MNQKLMKEIRENSELLKRIDSKKIVDNGDPVDTDINLETNVTKDTELSASVLVARQLTDNSYDMVDTEEKNSFDDLSITDNYSDYVFLEGENENITKNANVQVRTKIYIWRGRVQLIPYRKKSG